MFRIVICLGTLLLFQTALPAQVKPEKNVADSTTGKTAQKEEPVTDLVQFQMVRTDGSEIFLVKDIRDPNQKQKVVTETVEVPYTVIVDKGGKFETVTKTRTETRTRLVNPTIRKSIVAAQNYSFKNLERKAISKAELIRRLGMGNGRMVIQVFPKQKVPEAIKRQLSKDTIIMEYEPRNR